jgi:hypothetical protein
MSRASAGRAVNKGKEGKKAGPTGKTIPIHIRSESRERPFRMFQQRYWPNRGLKNPNSDNLNFEDLPENPERPA